MSVVSSFVYISIPVSSYQEGDGYH